MHLCFLSKQNFSSARTFHFGLINFDVYSGFPVCRMFWDHRLECRRWRLASKEAEAPPLDDCAVLEIVKHGVEKEHWALLHQVLLQAGGLLHAN